VFEQLTGAARHEPVGSSVLHRTVSRARVEAFMSPEPLPTSVTVVDDEPVAQDILVRAARSWDFECQAAGSAEQALRLLERRLTPILVTDLRMPGRGGLWLVREVRRRWPQVGIIVLTAGHDPDAAEQCLRAGHHYFFKPIKLDEYRHVLSAASRTYHLGEQERLRRAELERAVRRQTRRVRHTFLSAIDSLVRTLEERDPYTAGHSDRVRRYSLALAAELGLDKPTRRRLALAARLHDIGKVGVPEAILNKPAALADEEMAVVRQHPVIGERILAPIVRRRAVLAGIRSHHERLDGGGYPDGLRGDAIPLFGRLIAIPDCFDALTTSRAYRGALPAAQALEHLRAGAGKHYQPAFVSAFLRIAPRLTPDESEASPGNRENPLTSSYPI
jgi:response regulator RpfG family c-di-GMP phosphodiesterase